VVSPPPTQQPVLVPAAPAAGPVAPAGGTDGKSRSALATMVDPNEVCGTLPAKDEEQTLNTPDIHGELDLDMWKSLEGLLTLDGLEDFTMESTAAESGAGVEPGAQQETTVVAASPPSPVAPLAQITKDKSCIKRKLGYSSPHSQVSVSSPPPAMVPDTTHILEGHSFETRVVDGQTFVEVVFDEEQAGKLSPSSVLSVSDLSDSGFSGSISDGSASPLSDCAPAEESLNDFTISLDGAGFLEEFGELFPNIAY